MAPEFQRPNSIAEALSILARLGEEAKPLAGGQSLLVMLRQKLLRPQCLVDLGQVEGLDEIFVDPPGNLHIGSMVRDRLLELSPLIMNSWGVLSSAVSMISSVHVRNLGTLGGNLCQAAPGSDPQPALIALGATLIIIKQGGERQVSVEDFSKDFYTTVLEPNELLKEIVVPLVERGFKGGYYKFRVRSIDPAVVSVCVLLGPLQSGRLDKIRIAVGGGLSRPQRWREAETRLVGEPPAMDAVLGAIQEPGNKFGFISDHHAPAAYRQSILPVCLWRAIEKALGPGRGEG